MYWCDVMLCQMFVFFLFFERYHWYLCNCHWQIVDNIVWRVWATHTSIISYEVAFATKITQYWSFNINLVNTSTKIRFFRFTECEWSLVAMNHMLTSKHGSKISRTMTFNTLCYILQQLLIATSHLWLNSFSNGSSRVKIIYQWYMGVYVKTNNTVSSNFVGF